MKLTKAVTHIRLAGANAGKLVTLDALAEVYMALCQQYVAHFCRDAEPNKFAAPCFDSQLSQRWQRVAIQQAAGIAKAWCTNLVRAQADYAEEQAAWLAKPEGDEPPWREWHTPQLRVPCLQANQNVVLLEGAIDGYWLRISTLDKGKVLRLPVKLAAYHKQALGGLTPNSSVTLTRKGDGWWLTLTITEDVQPAATGKVVGVDVGIKSFITTSTDKHYGTIDERLRYRLRLDRAKRKRKSKLRSCLKKKDVTSLPSTANPRLGRHIRQQINRAINLFYADHPTAQVAIEALNVYSMKFKTRAMNAYLRASNLAHLPSQLEWGAAKRGLKLTHVKSAYTSQSCSQCHYTHRDNRPNQQTFCCGYCGYQANADYNAALNIAARVGDKELATCLGRDGIKSLLAVRHSEAAQRLVVVQPPTQLAFKWV